MYAVNFKARRMNFRRNNVFELSGAQRIHRTVRSLRKIPAVIQSLICGTRFQINYTFRKLCRVCHNIILSLRCKARVFQCSQNTISERRWWRGYRRERNLTGFRKPLYRRELVWSCR